MVEITNLNKIYNNGNGNLDINLLVQKGDIYAVLGPNGSGKTTLLRQIMGFIKPDSGSIDILNLNPWKNHAEVMAFTGYVSGELVSFNNLKGMQFLKYNASFRKNVDWDFVKRLIEYFDIDVTQKIKNMSKGTKQKIAIINAIMHKPDLLILDEPTSGLDLVMQKLFHDLIKQLNQKEKITIIISSHIFEEIASLAKKIIFLKNGKIIENFEVQSTNIDELQQRFLSHFERGVEI